MDIESAILSKVVDEHNLVPLLESKITPSFFEDEEHKMVFLWMLDYWKKYSEAPTERALYKNFPAYKLADAIEPLAYYIDEMRARRKYGLVVEGLQKAIEAIDEKETEEALAHLITTNVRIGTEVTALRDVNLSDNWEARLQKYEARKANPGGMLGIPTGWPTIDDVTGGLQNEQLVTFVGAPKMGKSVMLMKMAISVHEYGKVPMFVSFEMSEEEQEHRHDAIRARIDHRALVRGQLGKQEEKALYKALKSMGGMPAFHLTTDISSTTTVSGLSAKLMQYKPHVLFVDGVYLMDDEEGETQGSPQALTHITRSLKRLAQAQRIPIVISTQALEWKMNKKKEITSESVGYSSSFLQDSDVLLGVEETDTEDLVRIKVVRARNAPKKVILVRWDWTTMEFEEIEEDTDYAEEDDYDDPVSTI